MLDNFWFLIFFFNEILIGAVSSTDKKSTLLQNLKNQGSIKKHLACLKLHQKDEPVGGELLIGGCDVQAEHWGRVSGNGLWHIPIDKIESVGPDGKAKATICSAGSDVEGCMAVLDSGADPIGNQRLLNFKLINNQKRYLSFHFQSWARLHD